MADSKISALPASTTPLAGTETLPIVQSGVTKQVSVANLTAGRNTSVAKLNASDNVVITTSGKGIDFAASGGTLLNEQGGSLTLAASATATLFTPSSGKGYLVTVCASNGDANTSGVCFVISRYATSLPVLATIGAAGLSFSASGGALQITNTTAFSFDYVWTALQTL